MAPVAKEMAGCGAGGEPWNVLWMCRLSGPVPLSTSGPVARSGLQLQGQSFWSEVSGASQTHEAQSPQVDGSETPDPETCVWPSRVQCRQVSERASAVGGWSRGWVYVSAQAAPLTSPFSHPGGSGTGT